MRKIVAAVCIVCANLFAPAFVVTTAFAATLDKQTVTQKFKILDIKAAEVAFSGAGLHEVLSDDGSGAFAAPHWQDNSVPPNGTATDTGDRRFPISYTGGAKVLASAKFRVKPDPPSTVRLRALGPGFDLPAKVATASSGLLDYPASEATAALSAGTGLINSMVLDWQISVDGGVTWRKAGQTGNRVYKTLAEPLGAARLYQTVMHLATSNGAATTAAAATANTWAFFSGPANVKTWDGRSLFYYKAGEGFSTCAIDSGPLLASPTGSGQCGSFALLLMDALGANGIGSSFIGIGALADDKFLVKNWAFSSTQTFAGATPTHPWKMLLSEGGNGMVPPLANDIYGDLTNLLGLPGQNTPTPSEKVFGSHFIVLQGSNFYDPSYGVTYADASDFQSKAVAGFATHVAGEPAAQWHVRKPSGITDIGFFSTGREYR